MDQFVVVVILKVLPNMPVVYGTFESRREAQEWADHQKHLEGDTIFVTIVDKK